MPLRNTVELLLLLTIVLHVAIANRLPLTEVAVLNITRLENGDIFFITGGECGVTRCTEVSGGTALSDRPPGAAPPCSCRCPHNLPLFREDLLHCVNDITECPLVEFGTGSSASKLPFVFIPLSGQIVHPSKEINFNDSENAVCAVSGAQFLTRTGWSSLKNEADNDVPFNLYRDEGKTFLQWRGSEGTRSRATGRALLAKLSCKAGTRIFTPCVGFRVPGSPPDLNHDMSEVWFSHGELSAEKHEETSETNVMGGAAGVSIVFCSLLALLLYGTLLVFHLRNRNKRPLLVDVENPTFKDDSMPNTKVNPLVSIESFLIETQGASFDGLNTKSDSISSSSNSSDRQSSEKSFEMKDSDKCTRKYRPVKVVRTDTVLVTNATIHTQKSENINMRDERSVISCSQMCGERIPEQHVAIVEAPEAMGNCVSRSECYGNEFNPAVIGSQRKKLYFNPSYFEIHFLKSPPPAAVEFLTKIREVISIAKEKMLAKRFIPFLLPIPEEESALSIDFELSFPYESLSRYHTAHSLKRENSRRKNDCSGCPGCTDMKFKKKYLKTLSEKEFCKTCVSNEFKQDIVRKWLEEVPVSTEGDVDTLKQYRKSIAKVQGTPASIKPIVKPKNEEILKDTVKILKPSQDKILINVPSEPILRRKKLPPPPPPPPHKKIESFDSKSLEAKKKEDDARAIPPELKQKMNAVIHELSKFRKVEPIQPRSASPVSEVVTPFIPNSVIAVTPRLVIPTPPKYAKKLKPKIMSSREDQHHINSRPVREFEMDSLERSSAKRRASISNIDSNWMKAIENDRSCKRRSSIIAMEELEPMKKIYEMNSRLSRSFQELSATSSAWKDELFSLQDDDTYKNHQSNLVSEVYIDDYANTTISATDSERSNSSTLLKVKYKEPLTRPGQLVIEVEGPSKKIKVPDYEDFDPDTLDRKPGKLKLHKDICIGPISPNKGIDQLFNRSSESEDSNKDTLPKVKIGSLLEIFEAKNRSKNSLERNVSKSSDVTNVTVQSCNENYRPPIPPKKRIVKCIDDTSWENRSTYRIADKTRKSPEKDSINPNPAIKFRITRSEPNTKKESSRIHYPKVEVKEKKKFTTFGTMNVDATNNNSNKFHSLEANYENCYDDVEPDQKYYKKAIDRNKEESYEKIVVKNQSNLKRSGRRSSRQRYKRIEQNKMSKTEDSGYLSSDSNESRHKGKFILQVRDKDDTLKEMVSDTDDLDSVEDARSESGGESVETNSVFFGSFRRLSLAKDNLGIDLDQKGIDSGFHGDSSCKTDDERSLRKSRSKSAYREKFSALNV